MSYTLNVTRLIDAAVDVVERCRTDIELQREMAKQADPTTSLTGEIRVGGSRIEAWGPPDARCRVTQRIVELAPACSCTASRI